MQIVIYGKKIGMTQFFNKEGLCFPATLLHIYQSNIIEIKKNIENFIVLTGTNFSSNLKHKNIKKSLKISLEKKNCNFFEHLKECKFDKEINTFFQAGDSLDINLLKIGEKLKITGLSLGKGNQGNIKRNNFKRGPMTHGSKHHKLQGSLGEGTTPGRVFPGKKMPGRTGNRKITISGLEILDTLYEKNLLIVKGSIPGKFGNIIELKKN